MYYHFTDKKINSFPYLASFSSFTATIISDRWLVTAAHCFDSYPTTPGHVTIKRLNLNLDLEYDKVIIHPQFEYLLGLAPVNDIALLRLKDPLKFTDDVKPINLPDHEIQEGSQTFSIEEMPSKDLLLKSRLKIISSEESMKYFNSFQRYLIKSNLKTLVHSLVCTRPISKKQPCGSDDGCPLVRKGTLIGVAASSYVHYSSGGGDPTCYRLYFFTNILSYTEWIHSIIN